MFAGLIEEQAARGHGFHRAGLRFPKASAMEFFTPFRPESSSSLGLALVVSSSTPLILLNEQLVVQAASGSFCRALSVGPASVVGTELFAMGNGEWNIPQLRSLLTAIASGSAAAGAYEMDLKRAGDPVRCRGGSDRRPARHPRGNRPPRSVDVRSRHADPPSSTASRWR